MARDLRRLGLNFDEVDIEQDETLEHAYGESIPVLFHGERELARAPQTERSLKETLTRAGLLPVLR
jgi:hypothetical protein